MIGLPIGTQLQAGHNVQQMPLVCHHRLISAGSRVAGTLNAKQHAKYIKEKLMDYGLDSAGIDTYYVLLSVPGNMSNPSRVSTSPAWLWQ